jgi:hypothetical protein
LKRQLAELGYEHQAAARQSPHRRIAVGRDGVQLETDQLGRQHRELV